MLKRTVAKGTSDDEFAMFLWVCRKHKVDPVIGQIHCAMFPVTKHHKDEKGIWVPGEQMVIMMGINGYRSIAARNHKDFGGCDEATHTFFKDGRKTPAGKLIPESTTIRLWKKGLEHPIVSTVYWEEFAPKNLDSERGDFWNRMPKHKLGVVAESHALRKGYPDLSDIYVEEEMDQKAQDYSDGGRLLVESDGRTPSGMPARPDVQTWRGQDEVATQREKEKEVAMKRAKAWGEWCDKHQCHKSECPADEHTTAENDAWLGSRPGASAAEPSGQPPAPSSSPTRIITVRWTLDHRFAGVSGDAAAIKFLIPDLKKWGGEYLEVDDVWTIPEEHVISLAERCAIAGFGFQEILASPRVPPGQAGTAVNPRASAPTADALPADTQKGKVTKIKTGFKTTGKKTPFIKVIFNGKEMACFNSDLWGYLEQAREKFYECELIVKKSGKGFENITGIKNIGGREFEEGKIPVIDRNEERPKPGQLFA